MEEPRSLSSEEISLLKTQLSAVLNTSTNTNNTTAPSSLTEDMRDLMDYTVAMVMNGKSTHYIEEELKGMEMDICNPDKSAQIAKLLDDFLANMSMSKPAVVPSNSNKEIESALIVAMIVVMIAMMLIPAI